MSNQEVEKKLNFYISENEKLQVQIRNKNEVIDEMISKQSILKDEFYGNRINELELKVKSLIAQNSKVIAVNSSMADEISKL